MLPKRNRITRGVDYRLVVRRGRRLSSPDVIAYVRRGGNVPPRFGFIVAKTVGSAPVRNLVRRRLKAICFELLPGVATGTEIVFRALPASAQASWLNLHEEVTRVVRKAGTS